MLSTLKNLFSPSPLQSQAHEAYVALVAQARKPVFYTDYKVPDNVDGRFDVMVLHMFLIIHRLRREESTDAGEFIRTLSEVFFADMDRSLREMGVGDTGVATRIKKMAQAFYGRLAGYEQSFSKPAALKESLERNLYRGKETDKAAVDLVVNYLARNSEQLAHQSVAALLSGRLNFLD